MKRLGKVLHISKQNEIIIRGDEKEFSGSMRDMPRINYSVLDKSIKRVGKITSIFGPVDWPYFAVKPDKKIANSDLQEFIQERMYMQ
ncbi:Gar1/Naf1 family protein [Methanolobus sp. ZRKC3]|uniref:H/ACA ribonucleoprotein complex subunit GAR1 n=1 Tax=Methanolobus sp. ZRKC3 TaxID=3125786 RepID=UPI00324AC129